MISSNLISRDNRTFHDQKTLCNLHTHHFHKSNSTNQSNVQIPEQRHSIKPPTEEMDFAVKSPPLSQPPQRGLHCKLICALSAPIGSWYNVFNNFKPSLAIFMPNKIINHVISSHIALNCNEGDLQKTRDGSPRDKSLASNGQFIIW